jgi:hypothetical protein
VLLAALFAAVLAAPAAMGQSIVSQQLKDNEKWKAEAEKRQRELFEKARKYEQDKKYSQAVKSYRAAMEVTYDQWAMRKKTYDKPLDDKNDDPDAKYLSAFNKERVSFRGTLYDQAKKRIETVEGKSLTEELDEIDDKAQEAYNKKRYEESYGLYKKLKAEAEKKKDNAQAEPFLKRAESHINSLEKKAEMALGAAEKALDNKRADTALQKYLEFEKEFGGFDGHPDLHLRYLKLSENPALVAAKADADAKKHLAQADQYAKDRRLDYAYQEYRLVAQVFPDLEAGKKAAERVRQMEEDKAAMQKVVEAPRDRYARELLRRAEAALEQNDTIVARRLYTYITEQFADCAAPAATAAGKLRLVQTSPPAKDGETAQ